jgi:hypothetical protein
VFGFLDLPAIPTGTRAFRTGLLHMSLNLAVTVAYAVNFGWRHGSYAAQGRVAVEPLALSAISLAVLGVSGYLAASSPTATACGLLTNRPRPKGSSPAHLLMPHRHPGTPSKAEPPAELIARHPHAHRKREATAMNVAALIAWIVTAAGGFYLLATWIRNGGHRRVAGASSNFPPALIFGHFALAAVGLIVWISSWPPIRRRSRGRRSGCSS